MIYETLEVVELGSAEVAIEFVLPHGDEEVLDKELPPVAPYVEFDG